MIDIQAKVEQLWYVSPTDSRGREVGGVRISAASQGLLASGERVRRLDRYLRYELPHGADRHTITPEMAPISLSFIQTERAERLVIRKVYTGRDSFGRPGAYFIHLLAGLSSNFSTHSAIGLWKSDVWQQAGFQQQGKQSIELEALTVGDLRGSFASNFTLVKEALPSVIQAYLMRNASQHIYIAAPPEHVALLILGLTLCFPHQLLSNLTFSTYEKDVLRKDQVILIGTCWLPSASYGRREKQELPTECYARGLVINTYSQEKPDFTASTNVLDFAEYAGDCLVKGEMTKLEQLRNELEQEQQMSKEHLLEKFHKLMIASKKTERLDPSAVRGEPSSVQSGPLQKQKVMDILTSPERIGELKDPAMQHIIKDFVIGQKEWWNGMAKSKLISVREDAARSNAGDILKALTALARGTIYDLNLALSEKDQEGALGLLDFISCLAPVTENPDIWKFFLEVLSNNPAALSFWEFRVQLLKQWGKIPDAINKVQLHSWLMGTWSDFAELLSLDLPDEWYTMLLIVLLINSPNVPIPYLVIERMQRKAPDFIEKQMRLLLEKSANTSPAIKFLVRLGDYAKRMDLLDLLCGMESHQQRLIEAIEEILVSVSLSQEEVGQFLEKHGKLVLPYYQQLPTLVTLLEKYVWSIGLADLKHEATKKLLQIICETYDINLADESMALAQAWRKISVYIDQIDIERKTLMDLASTIHTLPSLVRAECIKELAPLFVSIVECDLDLYSVLYTMSAILIPSETRSLFTNMVEIVADEYRKTGLEIHLVPYIRVSLQLANVYVDLPAGELEQFMKQSLATLLRYGNQKAYDRLDSIAETWSPRIRAVWFACRHKG